MKELEFDENKVLDEKNKSLDERMEDSQKYRQKYYDLDNWEWKKAFLGENYTEDVLMNTKGPLSIDRTAGYNIASLMLLAEKNEKGEAKYTLEQILDPDQLKYVKQEKFKQIFEAHANSKDKPKENKKILIENMYKGMKAASEYSDKLLKGIDLSDEHFELTEDFQKLGRLQTIAFDVWQETCKFDEFLELVQKENPKIKTKKAAEDYMKQMAGPFGTWSKETNAIVDQHLKYKKTEDADFMKYVSGSIFNQHMKNTLLDWKENDKDIPFSQYVIKNNMPLKIVAVSNAIKWDVGPQYIYMSHDKGQKFDELAKNGSLFKNIEFKTDKNGIIEFGNMPTYDEAKGTFIIPPSKKIIKKDSVAISEKPAKLPQNFDNYIRLHTFAGGFNPKNNKEKAEAVCKVLAAYSLKKLGRKFDKKEIRETAEHINTIYCIKDNVRGRKLDEILQDKAAILKY